MCDDVCVMYAGAVVEYASVKELFSAPKHPYTVGLLNSVPRPGTGVSSPSRVSHQIWSEPA